MEKNASINTIQYNTIHIGVQRQEVEIRAVISKSLGAGGFLSSRTAGVKRVNVHILVAQTTSGFCFM